MAYNVILGHPTPNTTKAIMTFYFLLIHLELDDGKVGKLYGDQKIASECYYGSLKSLSRKERPLPSKTSPQNKSRKKVSIEGMVVLSTSAEEHGRPCPEPTYEVIAIPFVPNVQNRPSRLEKTLTL